MNSVKLENKLCARCKNIKSINDFYKCKSKKDGLQVYCKICTKEKAILNSNSESYVIDENGFKATKNFKNLKNSRFGKLVAIKPVGRTRTGVIEWECKCDCGNICVITSSNLSQKCTISCGCYRRDINKKEYGESSINRVYRRYKSSAKERNLEFCLTLEEFKNLCKENCIYCGSAPLNFQKSEYNNGNFIYNGIDRVDNTQGYLNTNTVSCCKNCNKAKDVMSKEEFLKWIEKVYKFSKLGNNEFNCEENMNLIDYSNI